LFCLLFFACGIGTLFICREYELIWDLKDDVQLWPFIVQGTQSKDSLHHHPFQVYVQRDCYAWFANMIQIFKHNQCFYCY